MENIKRRCNLILNLSKFTSNKKILNKVVAYFVAKLCFITKNMINLFLRGNDSRLYLKSCYTIGKRK